MDIDGTLDDVQLGEYKRVFPTLFEHPAVMGITLWGWRPGLWRNDQGAYIVLQDGTERPAMQWLKTYLDTVQLPIVSVEVANTNKPMQYELHQNYPNPFNPITRITYSIPQSSYITLKVYNLLGQEVTTLFEGVQQAGNHIVNFDATGLTSGIYFYRLQANGYVETKKLVLMK